MKNANIGKDIGNIGKIIGNIWAVIWRSIFGLICLLGVAVIFGLIWFFAGGWMAGTPLERLWILLLPIMAVGPMFLMEWAMLDSIGKYDSYQAEVEGATITRRVMARIKEFACNVAEYWRWVFGDLVDCVKTAWANPVIAVIALLAGLACGWIAIELLQNVLSMDFYYDMPEWLVVVVNVLAGLFVAAAELVVMCLTWVFFDNRDMIKEPK